MPCAACRNNVNNPQWVRVPNEIVLQHLHKDDMILFVFFNKWNGWYFFICDECWEAIRDVYDGMMTKEEWIIMHSHLPEQAQSSEGGNGNICIEVDGYSLTVYYASL